MSVCLERRLRGGGPTSISCSQSVYEGLHLRRRTAETNLDVKAPISVHSWVALALSLPALSPCIYSSAAHPAVMRDVCHGKVSHPSLQCSAQHLAHADTWHLSPPSFLPSHPTPPHTTPALLPRLHILQGLKAGLPDPSPSLACLTSHPTSSLSQPHWLPLSSFPQSITPPGPEQPPATPPPPCVPPSPSRRQPLSGTEGSLLSHHLSILLLHVMYA